MKNTFGTIKKQLIPLLLAFAATACDNTTPAKNTLDCPGSAPDATYLVAQGVTLADGTTGRVSMKSDGDLLTVTTYSPADLEKHSERFMSIDIDSHEAKTAHDIVSNACRKNNPNADYAKRNLDAYLTAFANCVDRDGHSFRPKNHGETSPK